MKFLKESKEFFQTKLRQLSKYEQEYVKKFIEIVQLTFEFAKKRKRDKISLEALDEFLKQIQPYLKYPFASRLNQFYKEINSHKTELAEIGEQEDNIKDYLKTHDEILNALKDNNIEKAIKLNTPERLNFLNKLDIQRKGITTFANRKFSNPFHFESNFLFFNKDALIHNFSEKEIKGLQEHFEKNQWTDYHNSLTTLADPAELIYAIQNMKAGNKGKVRITDEIDNWIRFNLKDDIKYQKALKLVNDFLHDNNKDKLQEVMNFINKIPLLKRANDKLKKEIKTVYRGVSIMEDDVTYDAKDVLNLDAAEKFVSTSTSEYAAKNFALAKGHLESSDTRRSKEAILITYEVDANSIILCVEIFGSVFGEREVLIDAKKVKKATVKWI